MPNNLFKKISSIAKAALLAALLPCFAVAQPEIMVSYADYKVQGDNIREIQQSILQNGIEAKAGLKFAAMTHYDVYWKPVFTKNAYGCQVAAIDTAVAIKYHMPVLVTNASLSGDARGQWQQYYQSLKTHEQGHAAIGIEAAKFIEWEAKNLLPKADCSDMEAAVNDMARKILDRYDAENIRYDQDTGHGHTQGAYFR
jgi:predicted secreted Zn-dependent protease